MELGPIFSLIAATLVALIPIMLYFGRRRIGKRNAPERLSGEPQGSPAGTGTERPILGRLLRDEDRTARIPAQSLGREEIARRERREAALIAGVPEPTADTRAGRTGRAGAAPRPAGVPGGGVEGRAATWSSFEARMSHLSPLKRAIVYGEVLGRPASLRDSWRSGEI
ncbi:MAG: hypothetical protein ACOCXN_00585 [Spirochaetota bacterium]